MSGEETFFFETWRPEQGSNPRFPTVLAGTFTTAPAPPHPATVQDSFPTNMMHWPIADLMLCQRRRRWTSFKSAMGQRLVFADLARWVEVNLVEKGREKIGSRKEWVATKFHWVWRTKLFGRPRRSTTQRSPPPNTCLCFTPVWKCKWWMCPSLNSHADLFRRFRLQLKLFGWCQEKRGARVWSGSVKCRLYLCESRLQTWKNWSNSVWKD